MRSNCCISKLLWLPETTPPRPPTADRRPPPSTLQPDVLHDVKSTDEGAYLIFDHLIDNLGEKTFGVLYSQDFFKSDMLQALKEISHCHSHIYIHRNLVPESLQFDGAGGTLKITDFGYAVTDNRTLLEYPAYEEDAIKYKAPELLLGLSYSCAVDIWASLFLVSMAAHSVVSVGEICLEAVMQLDCEPGLIDKLRD